MASLLAGDRFFSSHFPAKRFVLYLLAKLGCSRIPLACGQGIFMGAKNMGKKRDRSFLHPTTTIPLANSSWQNQP
ncbi:hypothetical protein [Geitlerinema sp. PCC 9228]|uniref:hypothetical protein n=1 Tax=Geitlerinema sp. PCC 9228 TaxID=111611 RepID=UPI001114860F|nr:hypothetical protein [Geitlerinema sp. PCC 9228]